MRFVEFCQHVGVSPPETFVRVGDLIKIVNDRHPAVGRVRTTYFDDFDGAQLGSFIWLEEDRSSPYEDVFRDAVLSVNSRARNDVAIRRFVLAKELMHVFDTEAERTGTADDFFRLLQQIGSPPLPDDESSQFQAERVAMWRAILALIPPDDRAAHLAEWREEQAPELGNRWRVPPSIIVVAMGPSYELAQRRFQESV